MKRPVFSEKTTAPLMHPRSVLLLFATRWTAEFKVSKCNKLSICQHGFREKNLHIYLLKYIRIKIYIFPGGPLLVTSYVSLSIRLLNNTRLPGHT